MSQIFPALPAPTASRAVWAAWYAQQGIPVFRLDGKRPLETGGFHTATTDAFQVHLWWQMHPTANIGIHMAAYWILDIDPRHGGDVQLAELVAQHGPLPPTALVHTGGSDHGLHYCWQYPIDGRVVRQRKLSLGVETRTTSGYGVAPPSIHPDSGRPYLWDVGQDLEEPGIAEAPDWLLALVCGSGAGVQGDGYTGPKTPNVEDGPDIVEGERNETLFRKGRKMREEGFDYAAILAALLSTNMRRCKPPLDNDAVSTIAWSCCRYDVPPTFDSKSARERGTQEATPGVLPGSTPAALPMDFTKELSGEQLVKMMMVSPRFLIRDLIPDGLTMLAAPSKSYKSFFALSLALATIGDGDWCDTFPIEELGDVVVFGLEASANQFRTRVAQLKPQFQPQALPHRIFFFTGLKALPSLREGLHDAIAQTIDHYKPRLIVIDPLTYLYRLGRQDDLASATLDLLWPLAEMAYNAGVALLAPEHLRKRSKEDVSQLDQLSGSFVKTAVSHAILNLQKEGEDCTIDTTLRDGPAQHLTLQILFQENRVQWQYKGSSANVAESRMQSLKEQVFRHLRELHIPMNVNALITDMGLPDNTRTKDNLRQILSRAERDGQVASSRRGEYYWIERTGNAL